MTTEEKARAYDEALERAKKFEEKYGGGYAGFVFPELAESEDERIRKALIWHLKAGEDFVSNGVTKEQTIAWLEKHSEEEIKKIRKEEYTNGFNDAAGFGKQKEQKPKQEPKWLYRLEFKDKSCGLWYNGKGEWCFESGIGSLDDSCKTKNLPMDYDERYKQDGRNWFSSCSKKEDLLHWYSKEDAKTLLNKGFVFTRYLATEYHEYDQQTVFIKETALYREEIDFFELMKEQKPADLSEMMVHKEPYIAPVPTPMVADEQFPPLEGLDAIKAKYYDDGFKNGFDEGVDSVKPAWSEEDEKLLNYAISMTDDAQVKRFLKSLRPQPKVEWSEEDEKRVKQLIYDTEAIRAGYEKRKESLGDDFNDELIKDCDEQINWLKSLRPSWKPSEEQMEALNYAIAEWDGGKKLEGLYALRDDLKKLM